MDQNTFQQSYGHYVTANLQIQLNKTYCQSTSAYHQYQIVFKDFSKLIVSCWIAFSLAKLSRLET